MGLNWLRIMIRCFWNWLRIYFLLWCWLRSDVLLVWNGVWLLRIWWLCVWFLYGLWYIWVVGGIWFVVDGFCYNWYWWFLLYRGERLGYVGIRWLFLLVGMWIWWWLLLNVVLFWYWVFWLRLLNWWYGWNVWNWRNWIYVR